MVDIALGRIPSPPDPRDWPIRSLLNIAGITLPIARIDRILGRSYPLRFDQGATSSCVGQSAALVKIVEERRDLHRHVPIDPYELWAGAKREDGTGDPDADRGTYIRAALEVMRQAAPVVDDGWQPRMRISSYWRVDSLEEAKAAIVATGPILVGASWYQSWFDPEPDGTLPEPDTEVGGHAFVIYGYDDRRQAFRAANSWSNLWADDGDFWVPYRFWGGPVDEAWKVVDAVDVEA